MRVPLFSVGVLARAVGFAAVVAIGVAALLHAVRHEPAPASKDAPGADAAGSIAAELVRCQGIGLAAQGDRSCLAAWAENRRRFFSEKHPVTRAADNTASHQLGR